MNTQKKGTLMSNILPKALNVSQTTSAHANCPHCNGLNYFNDADHPELFSKGGDVECDNYLLCGESFYIDLRETQRGVQ